MELKIEKLNYHDIVYYNNGKLYWKIKPHPRSGKNIGDEAGEFDGRYWRIRYLNTKQRRHRVIYFLHTGKWPKLIDHINQNKQDDRFENLREASSQLNSHNSTYFRGKVPYRGVHLHTDGRYRAQFVLNKKRVELGLFSTPEEASAAYESCKKTLIPYVK